MWRLVIRPSDFRDPPIGGHHKNGRHIVLERAVQKGEALNVEHVNLVYEEDTWHNLSLPFFSPLPHFGVDLLANFVPNLPRVPREEGEKPLGSGGEDRSWCYKFLGFYIHIFLNKYISFIFTPHPPLNICIHICFSTHIYIYIFGEGRSKGRECGEGGDRQTCC